MDDVLEPDGKEQNKTFVAMDVPRTKWYTPQGYLHTAETLVKTPETGACWEPNCTGSFLEISQLSGLQLLHMCKMRIISIHII